MNANPLDLRTWLAEVEKLGELKPRARADWNSSSARSASST